MSLTPEQARALWDAGGFALIQGLPRGSEVGMDGTYHVANVFSGTKFVPPGLHMMVWAPSPKTAPAHNPNEGAKIEEIPEGQTDAGPGIPDAAALPLRAAYVHVWEPKERIGLQFNPASENTSAPRTNIPEGELRELDPQLAPYPFAGLNGWKSLTTCISKAVVEKAIPGGKVDAMSQVKGETFDAKDKDAAAQEFLASTQASAGAPELHLPVFDLRRSWPEGSEAGDVSRWSVDKSKLWERLAGEAGGKLPSAAGELTIGPRALLGQLQLSFLLLTNVWCYAALAPYKRLLAVMCRSKLAIAQPERFPSGQANDNLTSLPETAFDTELPSVDTFLLGEIEQLRQNVSAALAEPGWWGLAQRVAREWQGLQQAGARFGWDIEALGSGDDDEDEEGEYAPQVVEMTED
ncbi:hypothetical protein A1Q2_05052 [Trichosporon asahii var. asahii CBS 8904]|uniref:A1 cistron-splicing factor n=1 Tax=Trichosporon asahii var. asahii (strain CBS 8904) TaxID=1220162 RepID=K1VMS5_TRIAC|nr:hypothetical protein A1Q2_05052 [Trichosporon asahii var. asahii CBS 8904]